MDLSRRRLLKWAGSGLGTYSIAEVVESILLGYGAVVGTDLIEQGGDGSLAALANDRFSIRDHYSLTLDGTRLRIDDGQRLTIDPDGKHIRRRLSDLDPDATTSLDERFGRKFDPVTELARDLPAIERRDVTYSFCDIDEFWSRLDTAKPRPFTVGAVRGPHYRTPDPETVKQFANRDPARPEFLVTDLTAAFRERTNYDMPRYIAGAIYYNLLFSTVDIREPFRSDVSMSAIAEDGGELFCMEYTWRSIEACHAVPAHRQTVPVVGAEIHDDRHRHVYTGLASLVRENDKLVVIMTFLDYMHAVLYDDFSLRGVLGDGLDAFGDRHRATDIYWGH